MPSEVSRSANPEEAKIGDAANMAPRKAVMRFLLAYIVTSGKDPILVG